MTLDVAIDFSESESISIKTWSPKADIPVRLKLEAADPAGEVCRIRCQYHRCRVSGRPLHGISQDRLAEVDMDYRGCIL